MKQQKFINLITLRKNEQIRKSFMESYKFGKSPKEREDPYA